MAVISGDTYGERAIAGTLTGRTNTSVGFGETQTTLAELNAAIEAHRVDTTNVHGITDTSSLSSGGGDSIDPLILHECKALTCDPGHTTAAAGTIGSGSMINFFKLWLPTNNTVISNMLIYISAAGASLTYARMGLYTSGGTLLGQTGDLTAAGAAGVMAIGQKTFAMTAESGQTLTRNSGIYYIGTCFEGTTKPQTYRANTVQTATNWNLTGASSRSMSVAGTTLPTSVNFTTATQRNDIFLMGLS